MKKYQVTNKEKLIKRLNSLIFPGCEGVLMGDVLYYQLDYLPIIKDSSKNMLRMIWWKLCTVREMFICQYKYKECGNSKALFLYTSSYGCRPDHLRAFDKIAHIFPESGYAIFDYRTKKLTFHNIRFIKYIKRWRAILKKENCCSSKLEQQYILKCMYEIFCEYKEAERVFGKNYNAVNQLVSWCDVHAVDSFFTQKFNMMKKNTITLQHGTIVTESGYWMAHGSRSAYFIAHDLRTKEKLYANGYSGKVVVAGSPYNIKNNNEDYKKNNYTLGVILASASLQEVNEALCAMITSLKLDVSILLKLHPGDKETVYNSAIIKKFNKVYNSEITTGDFLRKSTWTIIMPSTVIYEALYNGTPFILFDRGLDNYENYGIPREITAKDKDELYTKIKNMIDDKYRTIYKNLSDYLVIRGDIKENYKKSFNALNIF